MTNDGAGIEVTVLDVEGVTVVHVKGSVDMLTAATLGTRLLAAVAEHPRALIVDLTELEFLASMGLQVLLDAHAAAGPDTTMVVAADGPTTSRPLQITGIDDTIALYPTRAAALQALAG
ncbi:anti-sigma factor antagonist [Mycolicibacterium madagascariense]|uniref:Anti-sigma factor antagonist n=1 Tax=Mycolicibacterium madagascariense TaxID=212765 RepID=A0A7I7XH97_9MYCO|nr:STAS domain-containing protein [Mycolicibacterium madagascariense]MCV7014339.1 STAS domain-containing protein [Mycolicibacterium madagascariense]BBZ28570.1 anti-sigma factor antagonist [Mycolicibacterium madagascariense]